MNTNASAGASLAHKSPEMTLARLWAEIQSEGKLTIVCPLGNVAKIRKLMSGAKTAHNRRASKRGETLPMEERRLVSTLEEGQKLGPGLVKLTFYLRSAKPEKGLKLLDNPEAISTLGIVVTAQASGAREPKLAQLESVAQLEQAELELTDACFRPDEDGEDEYEEGELDPEKLTGFIML